MTSLDRIRSAHLARGDAPVALAALVLASLLALAACGTSPDPQRAFDQAKEAYLAKNYIGAERRLREVTAASPAFTAGHLYLGHALFFQKKYAEAVPEYETARALASKSGEMKRDEMRFLVEQLGMSYGMSGKLDRSKSLFEEAIASDADYPMYYYNLGCAQAEMGALQPALASIREGFARKSGMLHGTSFPNPRTDDSFRKYAGDPAFEAAMKEMGF